MSVDFPINEDPRFRLSTAVGGETSYSVPFPFQRNGDIALVRYAVDGAMFDLDEGADYSLAGAGNEGGGTASLVRPMLAGERMLRVGRAQLDRVRSVVRDGRFSSRAIDDDIDRWILIAQELRRDVDRAIKVPLGSSVAELPAPVAGKFWRWNPAGSAVEFVDVLSAGEVAVSAFWQDLLGTPDASAARDDLGLGALAVKDEVESGDLAAPVYQRVFENRLIDLRDFGPFGSNSSDNSAAVQAALDYLNPGDTLHTNLDLLVAGNMTLETSRITIQGRGRFRKDGAAGISHLFVMADFVDDVTWDGIHFDGAKASWAPGNPVSAILGHRNTGTVVRNCKFENFVDVGVKLRQSRRTTVDASRFFNMGENGCEFRWYKDDPRGGAWVGALPDVYGDLVVKGSHFEKIGRMETAGTGMVDGCGVTFDIQADALRPGRNVAVSGNSFVDCLRGIFSENNGGSRPFRTVAITGNSIMGLRATPDAWVKVGIGLINVENFAVVGNPISNIGNYNTIAEGSFNAGIVLSSNARDGVISANPINEDRGSGQRMNYCIKVSSGERVRIDGNPVRGASVAQIQVDVDPTTYNISLGSNLGG